MSNHQGLSLNLITTAFQARGVMLLQYRARELGFLVEYHVDTIILKTGDKPKFARLMKNAPMSRHGSVEEALSWLDGFGSGWSYGCLCAPVKKKDGSLKKVYRRGKGSKR